MSQPINFRRGTTVDRVLTTLGAGEPGWDTSTKSLYVGDGVTVGGIKVGGAPVTSDFTIYVATTTFGGTTGGSGLALKSGAATSTVANKLVDSGGGFTSASHLNKTVYNSTAKSWAKITAVNSGTTLSLSVDIMSSGDAYVICDAVSTLADAWARVPSPYYANITLLLSNEVHTGGVELVGKIPAGAYTITLSPSKNTCTLSGNIIIRQRVSMGSSSATLTITGKVTTYSGADVAWTSATTSGAGKVYIFGTAANTFTDCTGGVTIGNDPANVISINSSITSGYTYYVASSTYGGSDTAGDGLAMYGGSATSTTANKLVDSAANFGTDAVDKTIYNSTDDTWAKVTARDSATQLSLSADIMASGEAYIVANALATPTKALSLVPGTINCDTTLKFSPESFTGSCIVQGKAFSGTYNLIMKGTRAVVEAATTATGGLQGSSGTQGYLDNSGKSWTVDQHKNKWVYFSTSTTTVALRGKYYLIDSNTATRLTFIAAIDGAPVSGDTYTIVDCGTTIVSDTANTDSDATGVGASLWVAAGQKGLKCQGIKFDKSTGNAVALFIDGACKVAFEYCRISSSVYFLIYQYGDATFNDCFIYNAAGANTRALQSRGKGSYSFFYHSKVEGPNSGTTYGLMIDGAAAATYLGSIFEYFTNAILIRTNSYFSTFGTYTTYGYSRVRNNTTGVQAQTGGQAVIVSTITYTGNTTNENAIAASYGYITS